MLLIKTCKFCLNSFPSEESLKRHIVVYHKKTWKEYNDYGFNKKKIKDEKEKSGV